MRRKGSRLALISFVWVMLLAPRLLAGAQGTFRGEVVRPPRGEHSAGTLYLMGRDGNVRRVVLARAAVVYDPEVPSGDRTQSARKSLVPGTEVRVTALVDAKSGEWTASRVEVIAHHASEVEDQDKDDESSPDDVTTPKDSAVPLRTI